MKRFISFFLTGLAFSVNGFCGESDMKFKAMQDELNRTVSDLKIAGEPAAYYVTYRLAESQSAYVEAYMGALTASLEGQRCNASALFRAGSYEFDNSNYTGGSSSDRAASCAIDGNYDNLRRVFWDISDDAYKGAIETLARKKAFAEKQNITDKLPDFTKAEPAVSLKDANPQPIDRKKMEETAKKVTAVFKNYKEIESAVFKYSLSNMEIRYIDSSGSKVKRPSFACELSLTLDYRDRDGIGASRSFKGFYVSPKNIPSDDELLKIAKEYASEITASVNASSVTAYIGPVLFAGETGAKYFGNLFSAGVNRPRPFWSEQGYDVGAGSFYNKLGLRVSAPFISVTDNPLVKEHEGVYLSGAYDIDDEGVKAQQVELVKNGKLTGFPMSRTPTKEFSQSNGHGTYVEGFPYGRVSNLFVESSNFVPDAKLESRLIERVKELQLDYGILVTDFEGNNLTAYKVYLNGKKEIIRGLQFTKNEPSSLRNILVTGSVKYVYNSNVRSVTAPGMLIDEFELVNTNKKPDRFPYLKKP